MEVNSPMLTVGITDEKESFGEDIVSKALADLGVTYRHRNDQIVNTTTAAGFQADDAVKVRLAAYTAGRGC